MPTAVAQICGHVVLAVCLDVRTERRPQGLGAAVAISVEVKARRLTQHGAQPLDDDLPAQHGAEHHVRVAA